MVTILDIFNLAPSELFFKLFLPFALMLVVFFAVLQMTRLFNKKINLLISIIVTILIATTPMFSVIATLVTRYGAYTALIVFFAVFIIGVLSWGITRSREYITSIPQDKRQIRNEIKRLKKMLNKERDDRERLNILTKIDDLERLEKRM